MKGVRRKAYGSQHPLESFNMLLVCFQIIAVMGFIGSVTSSSMDIEQAITTIKDYVKTYHKTSNTGILCNIYSCCTISDTETCSISEFTKDETSLVLPGGSTRCIFRFVQTIIIMPRILSQ